MSDLVVPSQQDMGRIGSYDLGAGAPALFQSKGPEAERFYLEFFAAQIRNPNTRRAYLRSARAFSDFCVQRGLADLTVVRPIVVAAWVEQMMLVYSKLTVKQSLAAVRMLFDWLVTTGVMSSNPASAVKGPKYSVSKGTTPVLEFEDAAKLFSAISDQTLIGRRDRALIGVMIYTFARVGAVIQMRRKDYFYQGHRAWVRLYEKGGKVNEMPVHHVLQDYIESYLSGLELTPEAVLFQTMKPRTNQLTGWALRQGDAWRIVQRRSAAAGIQQHICNHSFRATGITCYLTNGGSLEIAQRMAGHESSRTTNLYDRRNDAIALTEVERIRF